MLTMVFGLPIAIIIWIIWRSKWKMTTKMATVLGVGAGMVVVILAALTAYMMLMTWRNPIEAWKIFLSCDASCFGN